MTNTQAAIECAFSEQTPTPQTGKHYALVIDSTQRTTVWLGKARTWGQLEPIRIVRLHGDGAGIKYAYPLHEYERANRLFRQLEYGEVTIDPACGF